MRVHHLKRSEKGKRGRAPRFWAITRLAKPWLRDAGVDLDHFGACDDAFLDCDVAIITCRRYHKRLHKLDPAGRDAVFGELQRIRDHVPTVIYLDEISSSGLTTFEVLPYVDRYLKRCMLRDTSLYRRQFVGGRIYLEYFREHLGTDVPDNTETPFVPLPEDQEHKLGLWWSTAYEDRRDMKTDWDRIRPWFDDLIEVLGRREHPLPYEDPAGSRDLDMVALLKTDGTPCYAQRIRALEILQAQQDPRLIAQTSIPYDQYMDALRRARSVLSLFGYGEPCWRDYETWVAGSLLVAADMSHLRLWPDLYLPGETYLPLRWDVSDLLEQLEWIRGHEAERLEIAREGQRRYRRLWTPDGKREWAEFFVDALKTARQASAQRTQGGPS